MRKRLSILLLSCAAMVTNAYAQYQSPLNETPANVKVCRSTSPKVIKDQTFYKADDTNHQKFSYEYDEKGLLASYTYLIWNKSSNEWDDHQKWVYSYNNDNTLLEEISLYNSSNWKNISKKVPTYVDGKITEELYYAWDPLNKDWEDVSIKCIYSYDANGFKTGYMQQYKKASEETWNEPNLKVTYTRNSAGNITEELSQLWDSETKTWVNNDQYVFEYDAEKDQMNSFFSKWKDNKWNTESKQKCFYDKDGDLTRVEYYNSLEDSSLDAYCIYTYIPSTSSGETGLTGIDAEVISVYPNPATTDINIKVPANFVNKQADIYDTAGQLVKSIDLDTEITRVTISNLSGGIYFVKIANQTIKMVKR